MGSIFNMFGPSPIKPIEQHMSTVNRCAQVLLPFFEAVLSGNWEQAEHCMHQISDEETKADTLKKELRLHLPKGLFLPVSRTDLLELLSCQDQIANIAEDIAGLIISRQMSIPEKLAPNFMPFLQQSIAASNQACKAINELDELLESGFRGREVNIVEEMIVQLDDIEHKTDEKLSQIRKQIFKLEQDMSPVDVIFLYKLVQWIGDLADQAQAVGGRLQILIAR